MPRRLGRKAQHRHEEQRPQPLQRERDAVPPLVRPGHEPREDTRGDELPDDEAHVGPAGEEDAQPHRQHLRRVGRRARDKDAPGQTAEELAHEQHDDAVREKGNEDESGEEHEGADDDELLAEARDEVAASDDAEEAADLAGVGEAGLPGGGELVAAVLVDELAVFLGELGIGEEVADEDGVVALLVLAHSSGWSGGLSAQTFHDDAHGYHERPEDGHGVYLDGIAEGELMGYLGGSSGCCLDLVGDDGVIDMLSLNGCLVLLFVR